LSNKWTGEDVAAVLANPIYTGIGPYPPIVTDDDWVKAASRSIEEEGAEVFLHRMLQVLRESLRGEA
jgi:hypothetical protein